MTEPGGVKRYTPSEMRAYLVSIADQCKLSDGRISEETWVRIDGNKHPILEAAIRYFPIKEALDADRRRR